MIIYKKVGDELDQTISFAREDCDNGVFSAKIELEFHEHPENNLSQTIVFDDVESCDDMEEYLELQGYVRVDKIMTA